MRKIWEKIRNRWKSYWQDDNTDTAKYYLSRQDKRSLLYGGFMISVPTIIVFLAAVTVSNYRTNRMNAENLAKVLDTVNTYLATATEDEYEEIAETIRHDLVYSQYNEDIEYLIQYIPNTADGCCLERDGYLSRSNLVFLNTGEMYGLDVFETGELPEPEEEGYSVQLTCGYDEISEASIHITKERGSGTGTADFYRGRDIISVHKMKEKFCDDCIREILDTVENEAVGEAVIYDTVEKKFYPVTEGTMQIGDYEFQTGYEQGNYEIQIEYMR